MEGIPSNNTEIEKEENTVETREGMFRIAVDYGKSFEEMIAAGHYDSDYHRSNVDGNPFEIGNGEGVAEFETRFFHSISPREARKEIEEADKENPWSPANPKHLLSLGATFPEEQLKVRVVAPNPIIKGGESSGSEDSRGMLCLDHYEDFRDHSKRRSLSVFWLDHGWDRDGCFLAVRPVRK